MIPIFFSELTNGKDPCVPFDTIPKTVEWFTSTTYGRLRIINSMNLMIKSLDTVVKALGKDEKFKLENFIHTKKVMVDGRKIFTKKLAYPDDYFKILDLYSKPITSLKKMTISQN